MSGLEARLAAVLTPLLPVDFEPHESQSIKDAALRDRAVLAGRLARAVTAALASEATDPAPEGDRAIWEREVLAQMLVTASEATDNEIPDFLLAASTAMLRARTGLLPEWADRRATDPGADAGPCSCWVGGHGVSMHDCPVHGVDADPGAGETVTEAPCGRDAGTRPGWMSPDQYDPCPCVRPKGHTGKCGCWDHDKPADAVGVRQPVDALARHRHEWADYIEKWSAAVGPKPPTVESIVVALRRTLPPFGVSAAQPVDPEATR